MRRGQSSIEFMLLAGAMLVGVTLTIVVAHNMLAQVQEDSQQATLDAIESAIMRELNHAYTTPSGYSRTYTLPQSIEGEPYFVFVREEEPPRADALIIAWQNSTRLRFITYNVNGTIGPGVNKITRISTGLILNSTVS